MKRLLLFLSVLVTVAGIGALCEASQQSSEPKAVIMVQPRDLFDVMEETVSFTLSADNAESYQWEYTSLPETAQEPYWIKATGNTSITGSDTDTLTVKTTGNNSRRFYRCAVTGPDGEIVYSEEVSFTIGSTLISSKRIAKAGVTGGICTLIAGLLDYILYKRSQRIDAT